MASVASQLTEKVTAHAQTDSLEDAREICADVTYFPNNLHNFPCKSTYKNPDDGTQLQPKHVAVNKLINVKCEFQYVYLGFVNAKRRSLASQ